MRYDRLKSESEIRGKLAEIPLYISLRDTLRSLDLSPYLFGGAVRDLAVFGEVKGDFDFLTISAGTNRFDSKAFESTILRWAEQNQLTTSVYPDDHIAISGKTTLFSADVHYPCTKPIQKLIRSDFSANGIAYDCRLNVFHDPLGGLNDLRAGTLRMHSPEYVITNAPNFPRMLRTACVLKIPVTGDLLRQLESVAPAIALHDRRANPRALLETLKLFSLRNSVEYTELFASLFFCHLFPEGLPLKLDIKNNQSRLLKNAAAARVLEAAVEPFLNDSFGQGITVRGYLSFVALFDGLGEAYHSFGKNSPYSAELKSQGVENYALRLQLNLIKHLAERYADTADLHRILLEMGALFELKENRSILLKTGKSAAADELLKNVPVTIAERVRVLEKVLSK